MADTYTLIEKITVGAAGTSDITFTSIPQTYTDLLIKVSLRTARTSDAGGDDLKMYFNGDFGSNYTTRTIVGNGATASSETLASSNLGIYGMTASNAGTANTFGNGEYYIPNYTSSSNKSASADTVSETNATTAYMRLSAGLWANTSAITSITFRAGSTLNFLQYSTAYLYGVAKEGVNPSLPSAPYATGGDSIVFDGTYWIHTFTSSGTFTPKKALTCDYLVVAGGGGGGSGFNTALQLGGGGGGAGGMRCTVTATGGGGSLESALSLTAQAYTVTIGAGGAGGDGVAPTSGRTGANGSNSVFSTITSTGGGGGVGRVGSAGSTGGSGGGNGLDSAAAGAGTANQGYGGGGGNSRAYGGGGGAGAIGGNGSGGNGTGTGGAGGTGVATSISGSSITYAGGGGGGGGVNGTGGAGGAGGGGAGRTLEAGQGIAGTANTGGGGGGGQGDDDSVANVSGGNGGSGIVIVRYAA